MLVGEFKKEINNSFKEIQENIAKQLEILKEETKKRHKELQESKGKKVKELNKTIQVLKMKVETIKRQGSGGTRL
jgi:polyhydroxyalkanoate synthesis regulator phasin